MLVLKLSGKKIAIYSSSGHILPVLEIRVFLARILRIADPGSLGQGSGGSRSGSLKNISNINKCLS